MQSVDAYLKEALYYQLWRISCINLCYQLPGIYKKWLSGAGTLDDNICI